MNVRNWGTVRATAVVFGALGLLALSGCPKGGARAEQERDARWGTVGTEATDETDGSDVADATDGADGTDQKSRLRRDPIKGPEDNR